MSQKELRDVNITNLVEMLLQAGSFDRGRPLSLRLAQDDKSLMIWSLQIVRDPNGRQRIMASELDGTVREQLILKDPITGAQVAAAGDESGADKGALHIKVKSLPKEDSQDMILAWLKVIAFHLAELRAGGETSRFPHISPDDLEEERLYGGQR